MPISALPQETVRLLSSPVTITSPLSLVKELIDNAIDAQATSIDVLISPNIIDNIEIRDNGTGIHPSDFDSLGRPGHTSKLRNFDELKIIGGTTLGFRGEALASANALAHINIVTRIAEELVATKLLLAVGGGVAKRETIAAPFGTTVKVTGLFERLPVRKQVAEKDAAKTIPKIKELLESYALARLSVRFSLKVLTKANSAWSYTPGKQSVLRDAVLQVVGSDVTSQCVEKTSSSQNPPAILSTAQQDNIQYAIDAFLPKQDADPTKIFGKAFFSIDSRPVSPVKGAMRKLLTMYRTYINRAFPSSCSNQHLKNVFLRVNIQCRPGSYDPNIEPSKSDVLFVDEQLLLDKFAVLLQEAYPPDQSCAEMPFERDGMDSAHEVTVQSGTESAPVPELRSKTLVTTCGMPKDDRPLESASSASETLTSSCHAVDLGGGVLQSNIQNDRPGDLINHDTLQASKDFLSSRRFAATNGPDTICDDADQGVEPPFGRQWKIDLSRLDDDDMSTDYAEQTPNSQRAEVVPMCEPQGSHSVPAEKSTIHNLNPFVLAKLNAKRVPAKLNSAGVNCFALAQSQPRQVSPSSDLEDSGSIMRMPGGPPRDLEMPPRQQILGSSPRGFQSSGERCAPYRGPLSSPHGLSFRPAHQSKLQKNNIDNDSNWNFGLLSPPSSSKAQRNKNPPFRPPMMADDGLKQATLDFNGGRSRANVQRQDISRDAPSLGMNEHVVQKIRKNHSMPAFTTLSRHGGEFNHENNGASSVRRQQDVLLRAIGADGRASTPHTDMENGERLVPIKDSNAAQEGRHIGTRITLGDPRAYLMRIQLSGHPQTPRRLQQGKTELLPLDKPDKETARLVHTIPLQTSNLALRVRRAAMLDSYVRKGTMSELVDLNKHPDEVTKLERSLRGLLRVEYGEAAEKVELNLRAHSRAFARGST